jgi:tellurite resistance-related uncharacterized protein
MTPYRTTPVFDQDSLPDALRRAHDTKAGIWGVIRVLEGELRYVIAESGREEILTPDRPGLVVPRQLHFVEPLGPMRMQVEFYDAEPAL